MAIQDDLNGAGQSYGSIVGNSEVTFGRFLAES